MKKRKLRGFVLPTIYLMILGVMAFGITFLSKNLLNQQEKKDENYNYTMSVFNEQEEQKEEEKKEETKEKTTAILPFTSEKVNIAKEFYNKEDSEEKQQNALIYYENTYMPNTGILYESDEVFDIIASIEGTVKDIKQDEILGTVLTIESDEITTIYYTFGELKVKVGDKVTQKMPIATSGESKLETSKKQTLLFEVYKNGTLTNPNSILEKTNA